MQLICEKTPGISSSQRSTRFRSGAELLSPCTSLLQVCSVTTTHKGRQNCASVSLPLKYGPVLVNTNLTRVNEFPSLHAQAIDLCCPRPNRGGRSKRAAPHRFRDITYLSYTIPTGEAKAVKPAPERQEEAPAVNHYQSLPAVRSGSLHPPVRLRASRLHTPLRLE